MESSPECTSSLTILSSTQSLGPSQTPTNYRMTLKHWSPGKGGGLIETCHQLNVTKERNRIPTTYTLKKSSPCEVTSTKYLGVELTEALHRRKHIQSTAVKANNLNKVSAFAYRNLKRRPTAVQTHNCYKSLVRPVLEYALWCWSPISNIWSPHWRWCNDSPRAASFMTSVPPQMPVAWWLSSS